MADKLKEVATEVLTAATTSPRAPRTGKAIHLELGGGRHDTLDEEFEKK